VSSIELLKAQARNFEQDEQWEKALDHYNLAIDQLEDDEMLGQTFLQKKNPMPCSDH